MGFLTLSEQVMSDEVLAVANLALVLAVEGKLDG